VADAQGQKGVRATGPFTYYPAVVGSTTYIGTADVEYEGGFQVCAPGGSTIFPEGGSSALADIRVFGIEKVADADGNPLEPSVEVPLDSPPGSQIAWAFTVYPDSYLFYPGICTDPLIEVTVHNPMVDDADYGDYVVTMKAQAVGSGIGVGSGSRYKLSLRGATLTDTTPPDVTINSPSDGSHILGVISVEIKATDPVPGTGVETMSATVSSAGEVVLNLDIPLAYTPQPAGSDVMGTGTFTPTGGFGPGGTTLVSAFTSVSRSGIGTYTLNAEAEDGAGNVGYASSGFEVKYDVQFTQEEAHLTGNANNNEGRFAFTVKRSNVTSDGSFIYDKTVVVQLVRSGDVVATHVFSASGNTNQVVRILDPDTSSAKYKTDFKRGDLGVTGLASYKARVLFLDVDGNLAYQAESVSVTF
jgi:hypothetical protein